MPTRGSIGPLMAALMEHLARVKALCTPEACELPVPKEIAAAIGYPRGSVEKAIERLRARKSQLARYVKDGRMSNGGRRVRRKRPTETLSVTAAALRSRSPLEQIWRFTGPGEL